MVGMTARSHAINTGTQIFRNPSHTLTHARARVVHARTRAYTTSTTGGKKTQIVNMRNMWIILTAFFIQHLPTALPPHVAAVVGVVVVASPMTPINKQINLADSDRLPGMQDERRKIDGHTGACGRRLAQRTVFGERERERDLCARVHYYFPTYTQSITTIQRQIE